LVDWNKSNFFWLFLKNRFWIFEKAPKGFKNFLGLHALKGFIKSNIPIKGIFPNATSKVIFESEYLLNYNLKPLIAAGSI